jgi:hypothetical protein
LKTLAAALRNLPRYTVGPLASVGIALPVAKALDTDGRLAELIDAALDFEGLCAGAQRKSQIAHLREAVIGLPALCRDPVAAGMINLAARQIEREKCVTVRSRNTYFYAKIHRFLVAVFWGVSLLDPGPNNKPQDVVILISP